MSDRGRAVSTFSVVLGAATWGTTGTAQALADVTSSPAVVGAARVVAGAVALLLLAAVVGRTGAPVRSAPRGALVVSGIAIAAYQLLFFSGVDRAGVAVGTVVGIGSVPVLTGMVAWVADRTAPSRAWWAATVLAVIGCALVLAPSGAVSVDPIGVALSLGAGLAYAVLTVSSRRLLDAGLAPTTAMAAVFAVGAVPGAMLLVTQDVSGLGSGRGFALVGWLAIVTVALGYVLYARGLRALPPATVGTLTLTEPLVAALLGVLLLGERPAPLAAAGATLLALGLVLVARGPAAQAEQAVPLGAHVHTGDG